MFSLFLKKAIDYFSADEKERVRYAIQEAEKNTSGEVRVYVEHYCKNGNAIPRAAEVFHSLKMDETANRNGVLIYIALSHKRMAIYADQGIYSKANESFWNDCLHKMQGHFKKEKFTDGIVAAIHEIGQKLTEYYPAASHEKNEMPDEIVFGKR